MDTIRVFLRDRLAVVGSLIILIAAGAAVSAPLISPHDPLKAVETLRLAPPGVQGFLKELEFVAATRSVGARDPRILARHILPNVLPPLLVYTTTLIGMMIVASSGLSFLGLGVQPSTPDWGVMVGNGRLVLSRAAHVATIPGVVIIAVALAFFVGEGLREALNPRSHR
jgi:ABC-type dipeptide/oligopeptide/nickel transport system permease subunit